MHISANTIEEWADCRAAQGELPRLVRRLVAASAPNARSSFPAGESIARAGWDGDVENATDSSGYVPAGRSCWELSCERAAGKKASEDYRKRTAQTLLDERASTTFVFVTPRRWPEKRAWVQKRIQHRDWAGVLAYDADDLEQWIELHAPVGVWLGEELGVYGCRVESPEHWWEQWAGSGVPSISSQGLLAERARAVNQLMDALRGNACAVEVRADSAQEAAAFVVAALRATPGPLAESHALIVTDPAGWRFMRANSGVRVAIAASLEAGAAAPLLDDTRIIRPLLAAPAFVDAPRPVIEIPRQSPDAFASALESGGLDGNEARRLARATGRSWSVLRDILVRKTGVAQKPLWIDSVQSRVLTTLCLLGGWDESNEGDRAVVETAAGMPYEDVERDLRALVAVDDAPVIRIGSVWRVKSPLALLYRVGARITSIELDRFFGLARAVLEAPDPTLEIPEDTRDWLAPMRGVERQHSGVLVTLMTDGIVRLAVDGPSLPRLADVAIEHRVRRLIREVLGSADAQRWLSLHGLLDDIAEAAPEEFLDAVEASLSASDQPIGAMFIETARNTSLFGGQCWYSKLLWAMETLARDPVHLSRATRLLAAMAGLHTRGRWANSPMESLRLILVPWLPQTAATAERRLGAIDAILEQHPDAGWELLQCLTLERARAVTKTPAPKWRCDPSCEAARPTPLQVFEMEVELQRRLLDRAEHRVDRLAKILEQRDGLRGPAIDRLLSQLHANIAGFTDADRVTLRDALRPLIAWHRRHDKENADVVERRLAPWVEVYDLLEPSELVSRHAWLFYTPLYEYHEHSDRAVDDELLVRRAAAFTKIYSAHGSESVDLLLAQGALPEAVGSGAARSVLSDDQIVAVFRPIPSSQPYKARHLECIRELLREVPRDRAEELGMRLLNAGHSVEDGRDGFFDVLCRFPFDARTWNRVEELGDDIAREYWRRVDMGTRLWPAAESGWDQCLSGLIRAERPRTALGAAELGLKFAPAPLLALVLRLLCAGKEPGVRMPSSYTIQEAIHRVRSSGELDQESVINLEFMLFEAMDDEARDRTLLYAKLKESPELYSEMIRIVYRRKDRALDPETTVIGEGATMCALAVLERFRRVPGMDECGKINRSALVAWIDGLRALCEKHDRIEVAEEHIGQILAHVHVGADGLWPTEEVRETLDRQSAQAVRDGFTMETFNRRGATWRGVLEGGAQERELVAHYRRHAGGLSAQYPLLGRALERIALDFGADGTREDHRAALCAEQL